MTGSGREPEFNSIFARFTDVDPSRLLQGLIAYGLYKRAKREWATDLFRREGRKPNDADLAGYERTSTNSQIDGKWGEADSLLSGYADDIVEAATPAIEKAALSGSWPRAIGYGLVINLIYTAILILVVLAAKYAGVDLLGIMTKIG